MKKVLLSVTIATSMLIASCGGGKDSPESIAEEWCDLDKAVSQATSDDEKQAAEGKRDAYEEKIKDKHGDDDAFMEQIGALVEACENQGY